jgi:GNAT superfamily N-acetyltransferase
MKGRLKITANNVENYFYLEPFASAEAVVLFKCPIDEYNEWLFQDAIRSQKDHIAKTWLLRELKTGKAAAYMSLIMDAIKLSFTEKELHSLNYPFKTIPAMKIAKLAVDETFSTRFKGIGSFLIGAAEGKALSCNDDYCAARFLTVDADIEHDEGVLAFYQKNGFVQNTELFNKSRKTISMRKDIWA